MSKGKAINTIYNYVTWALPSLRSLIRLLLILLVILIMYYIALHTKGIFLYWSYIHFTWKQCSVINHSSTRFQTQDLAISLQTTLNLSTLFLWWRDVLLSKASGSPHVYQLQRNQFSTLWSIWQQCRVSNGVTTATRSTPRVRPSQQTARNEPQP